MNRYPNLVGGGAIGAMSGRGNGFLRRRFFNVPGAYSFTLDPKIPANEKGLVRVKAVVIGGGAGGASNNGSPAAVPRGGAGAGYAEREFWIKMGGQTATIDVGAGGIASAIQNDAGRTGGTSSVVIDGVTIQATGGNTNGNGGTGTGGDINTSGGPSVTNGDNTKRISGSAAGSPWSNGEIGASGNDLPGGKWKIPTFWDFGDLKSVDDIALFKTFEGIGAGASSAANTPPYSFVPATFGGGGQGGFPQTSDGGPGLVILYW